jgi:hypothetical protein
MEAIYLPRFALDIFFSTERKSISTHGPQTVPKGIWDVPDKKTFPTVSPKASFF